jgi:membrane-bound lytic murein transglycosylase B
MLFPYNARTVRTCGIKELKVIRMIYSKPLSMLRLAGLCVAWLIGASACGAEPQLPTYEGREEVNAYIQELVAKHDFDAQWLQQAFAQAHFRQDIVDRISRPAEKTWSWGRYKSHLVDASRIDKGVEFWRAHRTTLARAEEVYGVAAEYIVAILGIETRYGTIKGGFPVLDALSTLGFDYTPRAKFFRKELTEFLLLAREEGKDPAALSGSYAGAMGYGQFIPSSFRNYAVDFDGDGLRDIWDNPVDAIGSIANYFARHKWSGKYPVALLVAESAAQDDERLDSLVNKKLALHKDVSTFIAAGLDVPENVAGDLAAGLFKFDADTHTEYWLVLPDFYVITRYNHSQLYALAVHQLAQAIGEGMELNES